MATIWPAVSQHRDVLMGLVYGAIMGSAGMRCADGVKQQPTEANGDDLEPAMDVVSWEARKGKLLRHVCYCNSEGVVSTRLQGWGY